jgi:tRNA-splicing ligase RtcB
VDLASLKALTPTQWVIPQHGSMRVPAHIVATRELVLGMDTTVATQLTHVAALPGIVGAAYALPDAHWGYGFPIGGVAAFDAQKGGIISAGGVGFDIACGVRCLRTGLTEADLNAHLHRLADTLAARIPAGLGSTSALRLTSSEMDAMLTGGAHWAVARGWGWPEDLLAIEDQGCVAGADPAAVSLSARQRQRDEMGTLGSGNHYLEVQTVQAIYDPVAAAAYGLRHGDVVVMIHSGSRGLGHQIGSEFLRRMAEAAPQHGLVLPDRDLACAPIQSPLGQAYLGAMRSAMNCALANRQILTHWTRTVFQAVFPNQALNVLYDVSHNTCKVETHWVENEVRELYVHRKGATPALGPGHPELPETLRAVGQPVLIGGSMGTHSWIMAGTQTSPRLAWSSACHGAGRAISRHQAHRTWRGRAIVDQLARRGILVRCPSQRGIAEEAPHAYKDVDAVVHAADQAGLARKVAQLVPRIVIKG